MFEEAYEDSYVDALKGLERTVHLPDGGLVQLCDVTPRLVPPGRTPEIGIVRFARASFGEGVKDATTDDKLIRYLVKNHHTSPLEACEVTFTLRMPIFVARHFLRHRTASVNEFSLRYAERDTEEIDYWRPTKEIHAIRKQSKFNKQVGDAEIESPDIEAKLTETMNLLDQVVTNYHELIKLGLCREVSRFCLPLGMFTDLKFKMDLNNLIKFFSLRCAPDAQYETRMYAEAMRELVTPLFPNIFSNV